MFLLSFTKAFLAHKEKVVGEDQVLNKRLRVTLQKLSLNPNHPS